MTEEERQRLITLEEQMSNLLGLGVLNNDLPSITIFNKRIALPTYSTTPSSCKAGEMALIGTDLKVCTAPDTWETVTVT